MLSAKSFDEPVKFGPIMAPYGRDALDKVAGVIDGVLAGLAASAAG